MSVFHVQVKGPTMARFALLGSGGRVTTLRVHAIMFDTREQAESVAAEVVSENEGWSAKVTERKPRAARGILGRPIFPVEPIPLRNNTPAQAMARYESYTNGGSR